MFAYATYDYLCTFLSVRNNFSQETNVITTKCYKKTPFKHVGKM